jgi:hypothetical protein
VEVTEQTRNLLISLASHMAYMQGQLEARHELDDPEDYYWYRESVALRQKVTDALADGPAVPEGREPASVATQPSDRELLELMPETMRDEFAYAATTCSDATGGQVKPRIFRVCLNTAALEYARAVLDRWGTSNQAEIGSSLGNAPAPVPVSERLPGDQLCWWYEPDEDDDGSGYGGNWTLLRIRGGVSYYTHWLPANALPLPQGEGEP